MELFLLFGLIFFGGLLIGLDLSQKSWWQRSSSNSFRQSHQKNFAPYSMQVNHFRNKFSLGKQPQFRHSLKEGFAKRGKSIRPSQPEKLTDNHVPTNPLQRVNIAKEQWRINHFQKANPDLKPIHGRGSHWSNSLEEHTELSSPQSINSAFAQTVKAPRQPDRTEEYTELNSPRSINPAFEQTIKRSQRAKPAIKRSQRAKPGKEQAESRFPQQTNITDSQTRIRFSRWTKLANYRSGSIFPTDKSN